MSVTELVRTGKLDPYDISTAFELWKENTGERKWLGINSRISWVNGVHWALRIQQTWADIPLGAALNELTKGEASIFYPVFRTEPWVQAPCPGCHHTVDVDAELICPACGHSFWEQQ